MLRCCLLVAAVAGVLGGCGLIDPDVTELDLSLPDKTFSIDTAQWDLQRADEVVGISCGEMPSVCADLAAEVCDDGECAGACAAAAPRTCVLTLLVAKWRPVDLATEKPELASIEEQSPLEVTIDAIRYQISENSLNVTTPAFTLYVAPSTVMTPAGAEKIGEIPPVPAGTTRPSTEVMLGAAGRAALASRMADFRTPFNIIVGTEIVVAAGDPVPSGKLTAQVSVDAHAGL